MWNSYEEARTQRLQENLKRFQELGISGISESLLEVVKAETDSAQHKPRPKPKPDLEILELRRSSRVAKNPVPVYREVDTDPSQYFQRRSSRRHTVSTASHKERLYAIETAEKFMNDLKSGHPAFVKSMLRSHVSGCFWLGLPSVFCKKYLPSQDLRMVLEDEQGLEYDSLYIASRTGLSAGWRGFSLDHDVDDGDALVFELSEPARFKVAKQELQQGENRELQRTDQGTTLGQYKQVTLIMLSDELEGKLNLRRVVCYEPRLDQDICRAEGAEGSLSASAGPFSVTRRSSGALKRAVRIQIHCSGKHEQELHQLDIYILRQAFRALQIEDPV